MRTVSGLLIAALIAQPLLAADKTLMVLESAFVGSVAADVVTTRRGLERGLVEKNPLVPNHPTWGPVTVGAWGAAGYGLLHWLHGRHPKLAKWAFVAGIAVHVAASITNERQGR